MYSVTTTVTNPSGLHARPASMFVEAAKCYVSKVFIKNVTRGSEAKNAKSVVLLLTLAIACGNQIEISAEGDDEVQAVTHLVKLIESGMGEGN